VQEKVLSILRRNQMLCLFIYFLTGLGVVMDSCTDMLHDCGFLLL
jgi:hypothetical protein